MANERTTAPPPGGMLENAKDLIKDTVGPLALLTLGAQAFTAALSKSVLEARALQQALNASSGADQLRKQFQALGQSASAARSQVAQLARLASSSAFSFASLGQAAKNLQTIGGASVNTAANMRKVMDVAAATGAPVESVAESLATLYERLKRGGEGAAGAAAELARMGAISQDTATQIAKFTAAGAPSSASIKILEADLSRANGASAEFSASLIGLSRQLVGLQNESDIKIGAMLDEGAKAGLRAQIQFEKVRAAMREAGAEKLAPLVGLKNSALEGVGNIVASSPVLSAGKKFAGAATDLSAGVAVAGLVGIFQALVFAGQKLFKTLTNNEGAVGKVFRGVRDNVLAEGGIGRAAWNASGRWLSSAPRMSAGSFTGLTIGAAVAAEAYSGLSAQYHNLTDEREQSQDETNRWIKGSYLSRRKNLNDSKAGVPSLAQGALSSQLSQTTQEQADIEAKRKEVEEAKKKYESHWKQPGFGNSKDEYGNFMPGVGDKFNNLLTGKVNDYNSLTYKQQQLKEMEREHGLSLKALEAVRKNSALTTGPLNSFQENALNMSPDGLQSRQMINDARINSLRIQQRFAPDGVARLGFKKEADDLEDKSATGRRAFELKNSLGVKDDDKGGMKSVWQMASAEVSRNRILSDIDQQGRPEMSSLARMGGSAGFAGVVGGPDQDQTKKIADLNTKIAADLATLLASVQKSAAATQPLIDKANKK